MPVFEFSLALSGVDPEDDTLEDRLYEAGCDDALVSVVKGRVVLDFTRDAKNFIHAVVSACKDVRAVGAEVVRIEPDSFATISDIAERTGLSRQAISLFVQGKRGPGDFPPPAMRVTTDSPMWNWTDVARWCWRHEKIDSPSMVVNASITEALNLVLDYRVAVVDDGCRSRRAMRAAIFESEHVPEFQGRYTV